MLSLPPDQHARQRAVEAPAHVFVWASAGTGKTYLLTQRALRLLLHAPYHPGARGTPAEHHYTATDRSQRIVAARFILQRFVLTTFTRKAAAEMQTRLFDALNDIARARAPEDLPGIAQPIVPSSLLAPSGFDALRAGAEALAELAAELQISTLHSFAARLLRRHPAAAGIGPDVTLAEEEDTPFRDLTEQLLHHWWEHVAADANLSQQLSTFVGYLRVSDIESWLKHVLRYPWLPDRLDLPRPDAQAVEEALKHLAALTAVQLPTRAKILDNHQKKLRALLQAYETGKPDGMWELCQQLHLIVQDLCDSKTIQNALKQNFDDSFVAYHIVQPLIRELLHTQLASVWGIWRTFLKTFADWSRDALVRELNVVTYDEIIRRAVRLLSEHPDVRRDERARLWAVLVDEFQDTDPVQLELLELLLRRERADDHIVHGFFVGDRKQSIYRFRDVDLPAIEAFRARYLDIVRAAPADLTEVHLTTSFRSTPAILDHVNEDFPRRFEGFYDYSPEALQPKPGTFPHSPPVEIHEVNRIGMRKDQFREAVARHLASRIEEYLAESKAHRLRDILVVVRSHHELSAMTAALEEVNLPVVSAGSLTFQRYPEVLDTLNLLIAMHHPGDSLAVGAVLHSPVVGLTGSEIVSLLNALSPAQVFDSNDPLPDCLPPHAQQRIARLRELHRLRTELNLSDWITRVHAVIPFAAYAARDPEGKSQLRIESILAAFQQIVEQGRLSPLVWLWEERGRSQRVDRDDERLGEDVALTDESADAIRVMTIHKAKGLEAPFVIVFLWGSILNDKDNRKPKVLEVTDHDGQQYRELRLDWGALRIQTDRYDEALQIDNKLENEERVRLAYVAATRAAQRLLIVSDTDDDMPPLTSKAQTTIVTLPTSAARPTAIVSDSASSLDAKRYREIWLPRWQRAAQPAQALLQHPSTSANEPERDLNDDLPERIADRMAQSREDALVAGSLAHRYLQIHLLDSAFDERKWEQLLATQSVPPPSENARARAQAALERFYRSPYRQRLQQARVLGRELRFFLAEAAEYWTGVMDLLLEEGNQLIIVDFKLSPPQQPLPEDYQRQRLIYEAAVRAQFPTRQVTMEFWWLE